MITVHLNRASLLTFKRTDTRELGVLKRYLLKEQLDQQGEPASSKRTICKQCLNFQRGHMITS